MFNNSYNEINIPVKSHYRVKGSKFITYVFKVKSESEVKEKINQIKREEKSANHHCYAYVLHPDKSAQKENDDGEPSSTAGKPILNQIMQNNLTNTLIIVVRYFGGIKLGISGLIKAYKHATLGALSKTTIISKNIKEQYEIKFDYIQTNLVMKLLKKLNLELISINSLEKSSIIFNVERNKADELLKYFKKNNLTNLKYLKTI